MCALTKKDKLYRSLNASLPLRQRLSSATPSHIDHWTTSGPPPHSIFFFFFTVPLGLWTRPTIHILKRALQDFGTARVIKAPNKSLLVEITAVRRETDDGRMELRTCQPFFPFFFPPPSPPSCLAGEVHVSGLLRGSITVGTGDWGGATEDRRCRHL